MSAFLAACSSDWPAVVVVVAGFALLGFVLWLATR